MFCDYYTLNYIHRVTVSCAKTRTVIAIIIIFKNFLRAFRRCFTRFFPIQRMRKVYLIAIRYFFRSFLYTFSSSFFLLYSLTRMHPAPGAALEDRLESFVRTCNKSL